MNQSAAVSVAAHAPARSHTSKRAFVRHYVEMVVVMFAGMGVLGGLTRLGLAVTGGSLDDVSGGLHITLMGLWMTIPMVAWMAYRGHTRAQNAEMAGSMLVPSMLAAGLTWTGVLDTGAGLALQHVVMLPAMLGVMLRRYDEYAHVHRG